MKTTISPIKEFKQLLRENDLKYDPWGTAMSAFFDLAAHLYEKGDCPHEWEFRVGMGGNHLDTESYYFDLFTALDANQLTEIGQLLHRYTYLLKRKGRDY